MIVSDDVSYSVIGLNALPSLGTGRNIGVSGVVSCGRCGDVIVVFCVMAFWPYISNRSDFCLKLGFSTPEAPWLCHMGSLSGNQCEVVGVCRGSWVTVAVGLTCPVSTSPRASLLGRVPAAMSSGSPKGVGPVPGFSRLGCSWAALSSSASLSASIDRGRLMGALGFGDLTSPESRGLPGLSSWLPPGT